MAQALDQTLLIGVLDAENELALIVAGDEIGDERGMVVWAEIPYISRHMPGGNENTVQQMKELVTQCYNHPSICVWGLSNEITMDGTVDLETAKSNFEDQIKVKYPELTSVEWPA